MRQPAFSELHIYYPVDSFKDAVAVGLVKIGGCRQILVSSLSFHPELYPFHGSIHHEVRGSLHLE